ncbi:DUF4232 domain-containing protein [Planotetraspora sp. GP83]|uniref:DUF4232 domain-containing protein n=1 Tax=Planotetraspora sp. GP83 TaxID=3156264 RepID=UPI0035147B2A
MEPIKRTARRVGASAAAAGLILAATACGSPTPSSTTSSRDISTSATKVASSATVRTAPAGRCRTTALKARFGEGDAGAGNHYAPLILTNTSSKTCWVYGFVGLIMIDGHGDALRTRTRRESVQPHRVTLKPGASAHARVHWTVVETGDETRCPTAKRLMIIPPDEVAHLEIPFTAMVCDHGRLDVTPMAPGTRL